MSFPDFVKSIQSALAEPPRKLKLFLIATSIHQATGYSKVTYNILKELSQLEWLDLFHFAIQDNPRVCQSRSLQVRTHRAGGEEGFGWNEVAAHITAEHPDVVMIYNDAVFISKYIAAFAQIPRSFRLWAYLDQVYECQPSASIEMLNRETDRIFVFNQEWQAILRSQGVLRPIHVLRHAVDPTVFYPILKETARTKLQIAPEATLFLSLNRNQARKRLDILVMAFVELLCRHPAAPLFLICVCDIGTSGGYPLLDIYARELWLREQSGVLDATKAFHKRLLITERNMDFEDEEICTYYNASDVGVACSEGEGFGLCTFEAMACGIPQVVSDVCGFRDYCSPECSQIVPTEIRSYKPLTASAGFAEEKVVDYRKVADAMEKYAMNPDLRAAHGQRAQEVATRTTWAQVIEPLKRQLYLQLHE